MKTEPSPFARLWGLDPEVAYLNHGSYGATPSAVLEHQSRLRERLEREPVQFLTRELESRLDDAREALARFIGADAEGLAFVPNATTAVNTILAGLALNPGDELLTAKHVYPACRNVLGFVAERAGARLVEADVPFPLSGEDEVVETVLSRVTKATRLALLDHVTSPTGVIFPVERLVAALRERGVETFVDGAHAVGMVPLDLRRIGAAYYTSNAHKWLCAPKGAAFLHVREDRREGLHPLVISHGLTAPLAGRSRFRREFDWTGTIDPTPALSIPESIRFLGEQVPGGWPAIMERNHALASRGRALVCEALHVAPPVPESMFGATASVPLPALAPESPAHVRKGDHLGALLFERRRIESWFYPWTCPGGQVVRLSAQLYNTEDEFRRLAAGLADIVAGTL